MKKILLQLSAFILIATSLTSCSGDDTVIQEEQNTHSFARGSYWDGTLGLDMGYGNYQITADPALLLADLEEQLRIGGDTVTLQRVRIVKKIATNDANDSAYMLTASDNISTTIGIMLSKSVDGKFQLQRDPEGIEDPKTVSCRGCNTGCNLEYLNMPGGKLPYCNENGCGPLCTKIETSLD
jgi:hypothetical protein